MRRKREDLTTLKRFNNFGFFLNVVNFLTAVISLAVTENVKEEV